MAKNYNHDVFLDARYLIKLTLEHNGDALCVNRRFKEFGSAVFSQHRFKGFEWLIWGC